MSDGYYIHWKEIYCDYMERHYRHTWEIDKDLLTGLQQHYFRYFRIIGNDPLDGEGRCLHFIGLEIYGHAFEE